MKRIAAGFLALTMLWLLCACGTAPSRTQTASPAEEAASAPVQAAEPTQTPEPTPEVTPEPEEYYELGLSYLNEFWPNKGTDLGEELAAKALECFTAAGEAGHVEAMIEAGRMFYEGSSLPQDLEKAIEWYTRAAEAGSGDGMYRLGELYEYSLEDKEKAIEWYTGAAEAGSQDGMYSLGRLYEFSQDNDEKAIEWYTAAAEAGSVRAMNRLGHIYHRQLIATYFGSPSLYDKASEWYIRAAENGDVDAMINYSGLVGQFGIGIEEFKKAEAWLLVAADSGSVEAMLRLGLFYTAGWLEDAKKASEIYARAMDAGSVEAMQHLGGNYETGFGVPKDIGKATELYVEAVRAIYEQPYTQHLSGYTDYVKFSAGYQRAVEIFKQEAESGDARAMCCIGIIYADIYTKYEEGLPWLIKAAEAGDAQGMRRLAEMYHYGRGTEVDLALAREWYEKAAEAGDPNAGYRLSELPG